MLGTITRRFAFALLTAVGFILMEAISGVQAAAPDFTHAVTPAVAPTWTSATADRFPACRAHREGDVAAVVVVADTSSDVRRMSTDLAWALNSDAEKANDVWVVGTC